VADDAPSPEELRQLQDALNALTVEQFLVSTASTLASLAYAKLEAKELVQAKQAIDALGSLVGHLEGDIQRELQGALTGLQVAFAQAASA
jgi:hypothetical protein